MKHIAHIFIDEMKNGSLPKEVNCNNDYYVIAAVVIAEDHLQEMRNVHTKILSTYFKQAGFLKSKSISRKSVWIDISNRLKAVPHYVAYMAIDMSKLDGEGLQSSKWSFEKYFQNLINKRFLDIFNEVHLNFDRTRSQKFQSSLEQYMQNKGFGTDLFSQNTFKCKDDIQEEPLLQIADFYAGIVGRYYRDAECDKAMGMSDVYESIRDRIIPLHFPYKEISLRIAQGLSKDEFNQEIFDIAVSSAKSYLEKHKEHETECEIVSHILDEAYKNPFRFVSSKEISRIMRLKHNKSKVNPIIIIGGIRDKNTLIVSHKHTKSGGYKLPCNEAEIHGFYNSFTLNVVPQLRRISIMNNVLLENSRGTINPLSHDDYKVLSELVDKARNTVLKIDENEIFKVN